MNSVQDNNTQKYKVLAINQKDIFSKIVELYGPTKVQTKERDMS
jgi:hypothetical protein